MPAVATRSVSGVTQCMINVALYVPCCHLVQGPLSGDARVGQGGRGDGASARHHGPPIKARHPAAVCAQQWLHLLPHLLLVHLPGHAGRPQAAVSPRKWQS